MLQRFRILVLLICLPFISCNNQDSETSTVESEQAYRDYESFVSEFEQDTLSETELRAIEQSEEDDSKWETETAEIDQEFYERRGQVTQNLENYSPEQQQQIKNLEERYNVAKQNRQQQYQDVSHRYKLRKELLGLEVSSDDLSEVTAENIAQTYQQFVSTVADNAENYQTRDWELIEGWWSTLNARRSAVKPNIDVPEIKLINEAQQKYLNIHGEYR